MENGLETPGKPVNRIFIFGGNPEPTYSLVFIIVHQDSRYAPGYFPPSIESGNLKFTSPWLITINFGYNVESSDIACWDKCERLFSNLCLLVSKTKN